MGNHGTKRKREEEDSIECDDTNSVDLHTPKRKRIKSTSKYIYQTLFLNGENSDVTILALNKEWKLHRHYLCQCGYFNSMFNGNWLESTQPTVEVDILDENIDEASLKIAFGSLYKDDVIFKPVQLVKVLAAATFLQLEGLIQHCVDMMTETMSGEIVVEYYNACQRYGLVKNKQLALNWLLHNIMSPPNFFVLKEISCELMIELITSPDLWVLQVEMDVYSLLRKWIFLRKKPSWTGRCKELLVDVDNFYKNSFKEKKLCYLELPEAKDCLPVFQRIRWQHVINDTSSLKALKCEKVVPEDWLNPLYKHQWFYRLQTEQNIDKGPNDNLEEDIFLKESTRYGRMLLRPGEFCWRFIGFNYGFDLLLSYVNGMVLVKRNCGNNCSGSIGLQDTRQIMLRLTAASLDNKGSILTEKTTGIQYLKLTRDEECVMLRVQPETVFPLYVTLNVLVYTPLPDYPCPQLDIKTPSTIDYTDVAVQTIGQTETIVITETNDTETDISGESETE
ncbi:germ cell-less protein-like 1 isoform X1 [Patella vulgata]|uniref:germ cell-less protein-like 1 isoform X1 n=2 Tax=Patella vulgata TaxID=6465 RepID=UPI00217FCFFD|nr:germ cell-less protein-like 1 isoform X1 [Patella vulgata]